MKNSDWFRSHSLAGVVMAFIALSGNGERLAPENQNAAARCLQSLGINYETGYRAMRIIDDHGTDRSWLMVQQSAHPEAPALLLQIRDNRSCAGLSIKGSERRPPTADQKQHPPVIRPGDSVVLSENSSIAEGRLEAIALEPAAAGKVLTVRLRLGGSLLHAVATGHGTARLVERNEVWR